MCLVTVCIQSAAFDPQWVLATSYTQDINSFVDLKRVEISFPRYLAEHHCFLHILSWTAIEPYLHTNSLLTCREFEMSMALSISSVYVWLHFLPLVSKADFAKHCLNFKKSEIKDNWFIVATPFVGHLVSNKKVISWSSWEIVAFLFGYILCSSCLITKLDHVFTPWNEWYSSTNAILVCRGW